MDLRNPNSSYFSYRANLPRKVEDDLFTPSHELFDSVSSESSLRSSPVRIEQFDVHNITRSTISIPPPLSRSRPLKSSHSPPRSLSSSPESASYSHCSIGPPLLSAPFPTHLSPGDTRPSVLQPLARSFPNSQAEDVPRHARYYLSDGTVTFLVSVSSPLFT